VPHRQQLGERDAVGGKTSTFVSFPRRKGKKLEEEGKEDWSFVDGGPYQVW